MGSNLAITTQERYFGFNRKLQQWGKMWIQFEELLEKGTKNKTELHNTVI